MTMTLTKEDVAAAYRAILGREPESEAAIIAHLGHTTLAELVNALFSSPERQSQELRPRERPKRINFFAYERCCAENIPFPDIPVFLAEYYGQCGEDLIVSALLRAWSRNQKFDLTGATYLEIGGNHPIATSASYLLNQTFGMRGVIVEANPALVPALQKTRSSDKIIHGAVQTADVDTVSLSVSKLSELSSLDPSFVTDWAAGSVGESQKISVPALRVNEIIRTYLDGKAPHFLSVDIEGLDLQVLRDLDLKKYRPVVIQAEPSEHHIPGNTNEMIAFLSENGYSLVAETPVNLIFTADEFFAKRNI
ncbi:MAG TPA: FkbM family methyltransferase [Paraburkholderia sp.]|uniref:FkbM family methyltransferase n=1 Tax=Paraburkholderia sp. TaxID=1926495 RepID=UPI002B4718D3|nr:FkbM family methyltransferase [Paraburkholderia sp.]HKR47012.1 FkbM family methyltransferase [Paraburkholderia sp.]